MSSFVGGGDASTHPEKVSTRAGGTQHISVWHVDRVTLAVGSRKRVGKVGGDKWSWGLTFDRLYNRK